MEMYCRSGNTQVKGSSISSADVECRGSGNFALGGAEGPVKVSMKGSGNTNIIGSGSDPLSMIPHNPRPPPFTSCHLSSLGQVLALWPRSLLEK